MSFGIFKGSHEEYETPSLFVVELVVEGGLCQNGSAVDIPDEGTGKDWQ